MVLESCFLHFSLDTACFEGKYTSYSQCILNTAFLCLLEEAEEREFILAHPPLPLPA